MLLDTSLDLIALAKSRQPEDRERLLMGVVALCESGAPEGNARVLLDQVFMTLVLETERDVRRRLAERIAEAEWAPKALINILALDEIEIARPVIAASPLLADTDLIRLIVEATLEHQIEVARRRNIAAPVVEALLNISQPAALAALAHNESARIPADGMNRLVDSARRLPALRAPLSRHPRLTEALGVRLYAWVGDALRSSLAERYKLDEKALTAAIGQAVDDAKTGQGRPAAPSAPPAPAERSAEQAWMERNLIEKLDAAGQLKPGFLLRALREGRLSLFEGCLARLAGLDVGDMERALAGERPEMLAMACMAAGVDRGVFTAMLGMVRDLNAGRPGGGADGLSRGLAVFQSCPPAQAAGNFRRMLAVI